MLEMNVFLKKFGKNVQVTSGKRQGESFLAVYDVAPREFLAGKMRVKEKRAVLKVDEKEILQLTLNDSLLIEGKEYAIESIDSDNSGMGVLYINGDM